MAVIRVELALCAIQRHQRNKPAAAWGLEFAGRLRRGAFSPSANLSRRHQRSLDYSGLRRQARNFMFRAW